MEQKSTEKLNLEPPSYSFPIRMTESKKKWTLLAIVFLLLAVIIVAGALIGVRLNQEYTEKVMEMAIMSNDGQQVHQTVVVNEQENVAAFIVKIDQNTATVLYDYKRSIIGFKQSNGKKCYVMNMDKTQTPKLDEITNAIQYYQTNNATLGSGFSYSLTELGKADNTNLGTSMNILCNDVPIYWAEMSKIRAFSVSFKVWGVKVTITIGKK